MMYVSTIIVAVVIVSHLHHSLTEGEDHLLPPLFTQFGSSAKLVIYIDVRALLISVSIIQRVPGLCTKPSTISVEHFACQPEHRSAGMAIPPSKSRLHTDTGYSNILFLILFLKV